MPDVQTTAADVMDQGFHEMKGLAREDAGGP
jgi:hypothetical protein